MENIVKNVISLILFAFNEISPRLLSTPIFFLDLKDIRHLQNDLKSRRSRNMLWINISQCFMPGKVEWKMLSHVHFLLLSVRYCPTFQAPLFCSQNSNLADTLKMCKRPNVPDASNKYLENPSSPFSIFKAKSFNLCECYDKRYVMK